MPDRISLHRNQSGWYFVAVSRAAEPIHVNRTTAAIDQAGANLKQHPAVQNVFAIAGFDLLPEARRPAVPRFSLPSRTGMERTTPDLDACNLPGTFMA